MLTTQVRPDTLVAVGPLTVRYLYWDDGRAHLRFSGVPFESDDFDDQAVALHPSQRVRLQLQTDTLDEVVMFIRRRGHHTKLYIDAPRHLQIRSFRGDLEDR